MTVRMVIGSPDGGAAPDCDADVALGAALDLVPDPAIPAGMADRIARNAMLVPQLATPAKPAAAAPIRLNFRSKTARGGWSRGLVGGFCAVAAGIAAMLLLTGPMPAPDASVGPAAAPAQLAVASPAVATGPVIEHAANRAAAAMVPAAHRPHEPAAPAIAEASSAAAAPRIILPASALAEQQLASTAPLTAPPAAVGSALAPALAAADPADDADDGGTGLGAAPEGNPTVPVHPRGYGFRGTGGVPASGPSGSGGFSRGQR